jgi:hypothetical protein
VLSRAWRSSARGSGEECPRGPAGLFPAWDTATISLGRFLVRRGNIERRMRHAEERCLPDLRGLKAIRRVPNDDRRFSSTGDRSENSFGMGFQIGAGSATGNELAPHMAIRGTPRGGSDPAGPPSVPAPRGGRHDVRTALRRSCRHHLSFFMPTKGPQMTKGLVNGLTSHISHRSCPTPGGTGSPMGRED